jgi:hypothetical protein
MFLALLSSLVALAPPALANLPEKGATKKHDKAAPTPQRASWRDLPAIHELLRRSFPVYGPTQSTAVRRKLGKILVIRLEPDPEARPSPHSSWHSLPPISAISSWLELDRVPVAMVLHDRRRVELPGTIHGIQVPEHDRWGVAG